MTVWRRKQPDPRSGSAGGGDPDGSAGGAGDRRGINPRSGIAEGGDSGGSAGGRRRIDPETVRVRGWIDLAVGLALCAIGGLVFLVQTVDLTRTAVTVAVYVLFVIGGLTALRGIWRLVATPRTGMLPAGGYKSLVAWRYLLDLDRGTSRATQLMLLATFLPSLALRWASSIFAAHDPAHPLVLCSGLLAVAFIATMVWGVLRRSKPAVIVWLLGVSLFLFALAGMALIKGTRLPLLDIDSPLRPVVMNALTVVQIVGAALAGLAMFFGYLRAFFTFFTVVPIGGVWIGTAALVMVLAVMSGFESDLRDKILGSNAHVQIARENGPFVEWREVQARIDQMPEVVASAPFAMSEVVIAANNTGMNVIIKGIDPERVGKVTKLVSDLEHPDALQRLEPIIDDRRDLRVPQPARPPAPGDVVDPPPADMPQPGEPIDFSGSNEPAEEAGGAGGQSAIDDAQAGTGAWQGLLEGPSLGDGARRLTDIDATADHARRYRPPPPVIDPPPDDLLTSDEPPTDYSSPDYTPESVVRVIDIPFDSPSLSRRTQMLPGVLVGRELVKQTHLYTGEEVRIVSPLSDPANPDATGTPIPYHRDFRVAGTFYTGMYEYDLKYVYVTLEALQDFLDLGDTVDGIEIRVRNLDETDAFVAKLQTMFGPGYRVQDWTQLNRSLFSALKLEKIAMFLVLGIVIMVASFAIVGNLIMVVQGKARQISLLKTLGASDAGVLQLFSTQGLMIGAIGTVLGVATGLLGCWAATRYGIPVSAEVYYIDRLPIHVEPMSVIAAASAGILISIAATLYPAIMAARIRPAAGLRH
jgi:lipoprotein-releasing system permease protein